MRAIVYCRVSTPEQSGPHRHSLAYQERQARAYADQRGWTVAKVICEVASGRDVERPGYRDLVARIEGQSADVVIVHRLDRLSRRTHDIYDLLEVTDRAGVGVVGIRESVDTTTATGRAMLGVAAVFAQFSREMTSENSREGKRRRAQSGRYCGPPNSPPLGYDYCRTTGGLVVNATEAETVRLIFRLRVEERWTAKRIVSHLDSHGLPRKRGGRWTEINVLKLLRLPLYAGIVAYRGESFDGQHEPIVARDTFEQAKAPGPLPKPGRPRLDSDARLLRGIAMCGYCDRPMGLRNWAAAGGNPSRDRWTSFYHHQRPGSRPRSACPCVSKVAHRLERAVVAKARQMARSVDLPDMVGRAECQRSRAYHDTSRQRHEVEKALQVLDAAHGRIATGYDDSVLTPDQFQAQRSALIAKQVALRRRASALELQLGTMDTSQADPQAAISTIRRLGTDWDGLTDSQRRELLRQAVVSLRIWPSVAELTLVGCPAVEIPLNFRGRREEE